MKHEFDPKLLADERAAALARRAAAHLDIESEGTAIPAEATWRLPALGAPHTGAGPAGPSLVEVVVRDSTGAESIDRLGGPHFDEDYLRYEMIRYWGDVLEARSWNTLRQLAQSYQSDAKLELTAT